MNKLYKNRVYGVQIVKSKNSNYNADFTGSPRTLPDGTVYSTDKVDKFNLRKYLGKDDSSQIFTKTTYKKDLKPMTLKEVYEYHFDKIGKEKSIALQNLLSKIDIRLFGATFAPKGADNMNISIHGPVQISYGVNRFKKMLDSGMYIDQIGSPYASKEGADQSTLGSQTRSQEAHYVHHYSINPKNLSSYIEQFMENEENQKSEFQLLSIDDVLKLKQAMALATTYYDSTSKKDSENELLLWIELNENSEKILKNFTELIDINSLENGKTGIDFKKAKTYLDNFTDDIINIEIYYDKEFTIIEGFEPSNIIKIYNNLNKVFSYDEKIQK